MENAKVPLQIAPAGLFLLSNVTYAKVNKRSSNVFVVMNSFAAYTESLFSIHCATEHGCQYKLINFICTELYFLNDDK